MNSEQQVGSTDEDLKGQSVELSCVVDAILEVGRERNALLQQLRVALESGDTIAALDLAGSLVGLKNEKSPRTN